jgi:hypothetical protein
MSSLSLISVEGRTAEEREHQVAGMPLSSPLAPLEYLEQRWRET